MPVPVRVIIRTMYSRYYRSTEFNPDDREHRLASMYGISDHSDIKEEEPWKMESTRNLSHRTAMTLRHSKTDVTQKQQSRRVESVTNFPESTTTTLRCSKSDATQKQPEPLRVESIVQRSTSDATQKQGSSRVEFAVNLTQSTPAVILQRSTSDVTQKQEPRKVESVSSLPPSTSAIVRHSSTNVITQDAASEKYKVQEIDRLCREDLDRLERSLREKKSKVEDREDRLKEMLTLLDKSVRHVEETRRNAEDKFRRYVEDFLKIRARVLMLQDQWNQQISRLHLNDDDATVYPELLARSKSNNDDDSIIYPTLVARSKSRDDATIYPELVARSKSRDDATIYSELVALSKSRDDAAIFSNVILESDSETKALKTSVTSVLLNQVPDGRVPMPHSSGSVENVAKSVNPMDRSSLYKLSLDVATSNTDVTLSSDRLFC